jgi:nicotinamidase-related amidase
VSATSFDPLGAEGRLVVCLDALEPVIDCDVPKPGGAGWTRNARRVLDHARRCGWSIAHVIAVRPSLGGGRWRAAPGLGPAPSEPVFHRPEPSAFSSYDFAAFAARSGRAELLLIGMSVEASCLATALEGVRLGRSVAVAADATAIPPVERDGLAGLMRVARPGPARLRIEHTARLLSGAPGLRLIPGGRA